MSYPERVFQIYDSLLCNQAPRRHRTTHAMKISQAGLMPLDWEPKKPKMIWKKKSSNLSTGIIFLEFKLSWRLGLLCTTPFHQSDVKAFLAPSLMEAAFINSSFLMILVCPPPSFLISSLPFSRPRKPVDWLKADGIDLEALLSWHSATHEAPDQGAVKGIFFLSKLLSKFSPQLIPSRFLSSFHHSRTTQERNEENVRTVSQQRQ